MASYEGQDIVRCQLCPNPVQHYCNICHVSLCWACATTHLADKTTRHEIVDFINRKEDGFIISDSDLSKGSHTIGDNITKLELGLTSTHVHVKATNFQKRVANLKERIIADLNGLQNFVNAVVPSENFDNIISGLQNKEDDICKNVRVLGNELRKKVTQQMRKSQDRNEDVPSSPEKNENVSDECVTSVNFRSIEDLTSKNMTKVGSQRPNSYDIKHSNAVPYCSQGQMHIVDPFILATIKSPYHYAPKGKLFKICCGEDTTLWLSGNDRKVYKIDQTASILEMFNVDSEVVDLTVTEQQKLIFSPRWPSSYVYECDINGKSVLMNISPWSPSGLSHTKNGDLLVSMRTSDMNQSRVVRFTGTTQFFVIQNDGQGKAMFSIGKIDALLLTENGNGDVCVADYAGEAMVVVDASGVLRFRYRGNLSTRSKYKSFNPLHIATDVNHQILINDFSNNVIHITNCDGRFIRFVEYSCNGGISIGPDHNLLAGNYFTGEVLVIKYQER